jgi:hypothetical protein
VSLLAWNDKKAGIIGTCWSWRKGTREEKHEAQTEEETPCPAYLYRSGGIEQALP